MEKYFEFMDRVAQVTSIEMEMISLKLAHHKFQWLVLVLIVLLVESHLWFMEFCNGHHFLGFVQMYILQIYLRWLKEIFMNQHLCSFIISILMHRTANECDIWIMNIYEEDIIRCTECTLFSITFPHACEVAMLCCHMG